MRVALQITLILSLPIATILAGCGEGEQVSPCPCGKHDSHPAGESNSEPPGDLQPVDSPVDEPRHDSPQSKGDEADDGKPLPPEVRAQQVSDMKWGMFICWSFSTFSNREWTKGVESVDFFNPSGMDVDQWVRTARDAGMGYILFLSKHHDGFCLWDTQTTDWKVTRSPLGKDVLGEVRKACDKYGIKLALYFSEGDWTWEDWKNPEMKKAQLKELCTQYGPIEFFWLDHAQYDGGLGHKETVAWIKQFQPNCLVGSNSGDQSAFDLRCSENGLPGPTPEGYLVKEFAKPILGVPRHRWFYTNPQWEQNALEPEHIYDLYLGAEAFGNIFSLDVGPNREGKLRPIDVHRLRAVGEMIREDVRPGSDSLAYQKPATASSSWSPDYMPDRAFDGLRATRWGGGRGTSAGWLEVDLGEVKAFDSAVLFEENYPRVKKFRILARSDVQEDWRTVFEGEQIGESKRFTFPEASGRFVRLEVTEADGTPTLSEFRLYHKSD